MNPDRAGSHSTHSRYDRIHIDLHIDRNRQDRASNTGAMLEPAMPGDASSNDTWAMQIVGAVDSPGLPARDQGNQGN